MRILIAPDKFKGSLTAAEAAAAMAEGALRVYPEAETVQFPVPTAARARWRPPSPPGTRSA